MTNEVLALLEGKKTVRLELTITPALDEAIKREAGRIGDGDAHGLRSEAVRQLLVRGVLASE
jgi:hypothetical protein